MKKYLNISTGKLIEEGEEVEEPVKAKEVVNDTGEEVSEDAYEEVVR